MLQAFHTLITENSSLTQQLRTLPNLEMLRIVHRKRKFRQSKAPVETANKDIEDMLKT